MRKSFLLTVFLAGVAPSPFLAAEPHVMLVGVWPNRMQFLEEETFELVSQFPLKNGAVVWDTGGYARTSRAADDSRLYFITGTMETLEIVDVAAQEVVNEVKLSTPERKVRLIGAVPTPAGQQVYLTVRAVDMGIDRLVLDRTVDFVLFDLEKHEVVKSFALPDGVLTGEPPGLWMSPDGDALFAPAGDKIYELSTETHEVVRTIEVMKPRFAGYGARNAPMWFETQTGTYYSAYVTVDPVIERSATGIVRFDVSSRTVTGFEIGPSLRMPLVVGLSPDGKRAYLGGNDLAVVDLESRQLVLHREGFERGRANTGWVVSTDGTKLYVGGVGDRIKIYDAGSLELLEEKVLEGDAMFAPFLLPRRLIERSSQ